MYNDQGTLFGAITQSPGMSGWDGDPNRDPLETQKPSTWTTRCKPAHTGEQHTVTTDSAKKIPLAMPMLIDVGAYLLGQAGEIFSGSYEGLRLKLEGEPSW